MKLEHLKSGVEAYQVGSLFMMMNKDIICIIHKDRQTIRVCEIVKIQSFFKAMEIFNVNKISLETFSKEIPKTEEGNIVAQFLAMIISSETDAMIERFIEEGVHPFEADEEPSGELVDLSELNEVLKNQNIGIIGLN